MTSTSLVSVREGLRALVIHNTGGPLPDAVAISSLRLLVDEVRVRVSVGDDGQVTVGPVGDTVRARLTGLLLVVEAAQRDGTWTHLKACANDDCQWAFYDRSRNHGGTWCDMASCGNKLKNRDFRARKRVTTLSRHVPDDRRGQCAEPVQRPVQCDRCDQAAAAPAQPREHEARRRRSRPPRARLPRPCRATAAEQPR